MGKGTATAIFLEIVMKMKMKDQWVLFISTEKYAYWQVQIVKHEFNPFATIDHDTTDDTVNEEESIWYSILHYKVLVDIYIYIHTHVEVESGSELT